MNDPARLAARNNAEWCEAVCRANGAGGEFRDGLWLSFGRTPAFHPNLVTLDPGAVATQMEAVAFLAEHRPEGFAAKDSFARLDLSPLGFSPVLKAEWIFSSASPETVPASDIEWRIVGDRETLAVWELAAGGDPDEDPVFVATLLDHPAIAFLAGWRGGRIAAGAALFRSEGALGLAWVFVPDGDDGSVRAALALEARKTAPGLPLVGYETGEDLAAFRKLGFESVGPLVVWAC